MQEHLAYTEPTSKQISVVFAGEVIADSGRALVMHETNRAPAYYIPFEDVRMDLMEPSDHKTH